MNEKALEAAARKVAVQIQRIGGWLPFDDLPDMAQQDVLADARQIAEEAVNTYLAGASLVEDTGDLYRWCGCGYNKCRTIRQELLNDGNLVPVGEEPE